MYPKIKKKKKKKEILCKENGTQKYCEGLVNPTVAR
jgi:hypothetical protein